MRGAEPLLRCYILTEMTNFPPIWFFVQSTADKNDDKINKKPLTSEKYSTNKE